MINEESFRELYRQTAAPLRQYIARSMGSSGLADDIAQDAFLRLLRHPPPIDDLQRLRAYLFRIASNLIIDHWRGQKHETDLSTLPEEIQAPEPIDADAALSREMNGMFQQLRPLDRQMMWLAYVEGANHREIAGALGLRERSVRVLLSRAREKLHRMLRVAAKPDKPKRAQQRSSKVGSDSMATLSLVDEQNV